MKSIIKKIIFFVGVFISYIIPYSMFNHLRIIFNLFYSSYLTRNFQYFGNSNISYPIRGLLGGKYISIEDNVSLGKTLFLQHGIIMKMKNFHLK